MPKTQKAPVKQSIDAAVHQELLEKLQAKRKDILTIYEHDLRAGQQTTDEVGEDIVDRANNSYNRELFLALSDGERTTLLRIDEALARFEDGSYGRCVHCGQPIGPGRLEALPWARYCIDCQEREEQGMLGETED